jgi:hypothetical protein
MSKVRAAFCSRRRHRKTWLLTRPGGPALDRNVDIGWIDVEPAEAPSGSLGRKQRRPRAQEDIQHKIAVPGDVLDGRQSALILLVFLAISDALPSISPSNATRTPADRNGDSSGAASVQPLKIQLDPARVRLVH